MRREDGQAGVVHVGEADHHPVGAVVAGRAALVAVGEGRLVAVVAVGDQHLLVGQQRDDAVDGRARDRAQAAGVAVAVERHEGGRGRRRSRRQGPPDLVVGVGVQQEDLAQVGVRRAQQFEAIDLGAGVRLFVGQHDARREVFEAQAADKAGARALLPVGAGEALLDQVEGRFVVGEQHALVAPGAQQLGRGGVAARGRALRRHGELDVDGVVRAAAAQRVGHGRRDHVVGRADGVGQRHAVGVVPQAAEGTDVSHVGSPLALGFGCATKTERVAESTA